MDSAVTFDDHVSTLSSSGLYNLHRINRIKHLLDNKTLILIINALISVGFSICSGSDICNHVLLRVHHLANRLVLLLESRVFSSLAKLLHLATRIKVEHKTNFSGILGFGRLFKWTNWSCGV